MSLLPTKTYQPETLKGYIRNFEVFDVPNLCPPSFQVLPLGIVQIFIQFNNNVYHNTSFSNGWQERPKVFIAGPFNKGYTLSPQRGTKMFAINLEIGKNRYFFKTPIQHLRNHLISPGDIWGVEGVDFIDKIYNAKNDVQRCQISEVFLMNQWRPLEKSVIEIVTIEMVQAQGIGSVSNWAATANLSVAQFRNRFNQEIGLSPKDFSKVIRIEALSHYLEKMSEISLTKLSYKFQYHDQSHFIKDFRSITGQSPKTYFS